MASGHIRNIGPFSTVQRHKCMYWMVNYGLNTRVCEIFVSPAGQTDQHGIDFSWSFQFFAGPCVKIHVRRLEIWWTVGPARVGDLLDLQDFWWSGPKVHHFSQTLL